MTNGEIPNDERRPNGENRFYPFAIGIVCHS